MKKLIIILIVIAIPQLGFSQVGINTTSPNAQFDVRSSNQASPTNTDGILIPKIDAFPLTNPTAAQNSMMVYLTTTSSGKSPGFYYWDEATTSWKGFGGMSDADFYEVATTNPPDAITDAMFHSGNVGIGNATPTCKLDVEETTSLISSVINVKHSNPTSTAKLIKTTVNSGALASGVITSNENNIALTNSVQGIGVLNAISGTTNDAVYGFRNLISNVGSSIKYGLNNSFTGTGTGSVYGVSNRFATNTTTQQNGVFNNFTGTPAGLGVGLHNVIEDSGDGTKIGVLDSITNTGNGRHFGIKNAFKGDGSGQRLGIYSKFTGTGNGAVWGSYNEFNRNGSGNIIGNETLISSDGSGVHYGTQNTISGNGTGTQVGTENYIGVYNTTTDAQRGTTNFLTGDTSGVQTGTYNSITGSGSGFQYGSYNSIFGTGVGDKYGSYSYIHPSSNGMQYGVYSDVSKPTGYAGYFLGRFSIGTTLTNNYILPASRGTLNQIMQTDAAGMVTWQNPSTVLANVAWTVTGNGGTSPATNFIGTTDNANVVFKRFNVKAGLLDASSTSFGVNTSNSGNYNVAIGVDALALNTFGNYNTAVGHGSLTKNTTAYNNVAIGVNALMKQTFPNGNVPYSTDNVAVGVAALAFNSPTTTSNGKDNVAVGNTALNQNTTGSFNTAVGTRALYGYPGNSTGNYNSAFGWNALYRNMGSYNTGLGVNALVNLASGDFNTVVGTNSMLGNTGSSNNTTLGYATLQNNVSGSGNVAIGNEAGANETGSNKLYIENTNSAAPLIYGDFSTDLLRTNGSFRVKSTTITGDEMQVKNSNLYTHPTDANLNFGSGSGYFMVSTQDAPTNGAIDTGGIYGDGNSVTIWSPGDGNSGQPGALVYFVDEDAWGDNNGNPYDNVALKSYVSAAGAYVQISDQNKKEHIVKIDNALDKISQINGYTYEFKLAPNEIQKGDKQIRSSGVLAQELEKVLPEAVQKSDKGDYFVDYAAITPLLIEAIKSQNEKIEQLQKSNEEILRRIKLLEKQ